MSHRSLDDILLSCGTMCYRDVDHILLGHQRYDTGLWTMCYRAMDLFYRVLGRFITGPRISGSWTIFYRTIDNVVQYC